MLTNAAPSRLAIAAGLILATAAPTIAHQQPGPSCREIRTLDAMEYWFWDGFSGLVDVIDFEQERLGRLSVDRGICVRIALVTVDNPQQKNAGYRQAVSELIMWLADDEVSRDAVRRVRNQLERMTGEDFDNHAEWNDWWEARIDFVLWSDEDDQLVVITSAMEAGEAIHDEALVLSAEEYWFYAGRGWVLSSEDVGQYVLGSVLIPPHDFSFRAVAADLEDRGAKERGFRRALENMVGDGLLAPELPDDSLAAILDQLAALTGERPRDRDGWVAWWTANSERLVLSASGDRLVVGR